MLLPFILLFAFIDKKTLVKTQERKENKMKYNLNDNVELVKVRTVWLLSNFDNQSIIGLDSKGVQFWEHMKEGSICEQEIKENKELYESLFELGFIFKEKSNKENEWGISSAYVHLLNRCNLSCLGCYSMNDGRNVECDATTDKWKTGFERLAQAGVNSIVVSGGEPLLRKDIAELLQYAKMDAGIENITLITNGTVDFQFELLKGYVNTIAVSVDGYNKSHPSFLRNEGIFDKIMSTIRQIKAVGIEVSIVPTLHMKNYDAMKMYDELAEELQVAISFSILSVPCNEIFKDYILNDNALSEIAESVIKLNADVDDMKTAGEGLCAMKSCGLAQNMISIDSKGDIYPCHILHDESLLLGNIFEKPLKLGNLNRNVIEHCTSANVDNIEGCKSCDYRYLCGGGCRGRAFLKYKNLLAKDSYCTLFHRFHEIEMDTIQQGIKNAE